MSAEAKPRAAPRRPVPRGRPEPCMHGAPRRLGAALG